MDRWEIFLRTFADRVSKSRENHLTTRCWKLSTLRNEIKTDGLDIPGRSRIADEHLAKIQRNDLDRRVGAVLEMIGANFAASTLGRWLKAVRDRLMTQDVTEIPLLSGFEFPEQNKNWKVRIP